MKRLLSLLFAIVFVLASVSMVACGNKRAPYNPDNFLPNGTEENPYQIVKEPVTIRIFIPKSTMISSIPELVCFQELSQLTNIKFKFIEADVASYTELRTTTWENKKNLPDLFLFLNQIAEQQKFAKYGALVPWNDESLEVEGLSVGSLIDNYMPNYSALLESNFGVENIAYAASDVATLDDGHMYSLICYNGSTRDRTYAMYLNEKWIDRLNDDYGLNLTKNPQSIEEYLTVLRAFKQYDANGNGDASDEIPCSAVNLLNLRNFILQSYGYVSNGVEIENDGSRFVYVPSTQAYREYLKIMNTMFAEKLLDNSTFEMTGGSQIAVKGYANRLGSFADAAAYLSVGYEYDQDYITIGPLTSAWYNHKQTYMCASGPVFSPTGAIIPKGTPYVREIARLLDILYTDYGSALMGIGVENENWHWNNDKSLWIFDIPESWSGTSEEYRATISPSVGTGCTLYQSVEFAQANGDPVMRREIQLAERYQDCIKNTEPETFYLNESDSNRVAVIKASIDVYVRSMEYNFITGEKDPGSDTDWNNYISTLKQYNSDELLEIYNKALAAG